MSRDQYGEMVWIEKGPDLRIARDDFEPVCYSVTV